MVVQQDVSDGAEGRCQVLFDETQGLPAGPAEVTVTLYDSLGGADSRRLAIWVLPSNPLSLFVSPGGRSIYNGSVRPDWESPNWVTRLDITFLNGDASSVTVQRGVTWRFWDGGVGGREHLRLGGGGGAFVVDPRRGFEMLRAAAEGKLARPHAIEPYDPAYIGDDLTMPGSPPPYDPDNPDHEVVRTHLIDPDGRDDDPLLDYFALLDLITA